MRTALWFFFLSLLLAGCVVGPVPRYRVRQVKPAGISSEEVVRLTKAGLSDSVLLEKIKSEGVAARPSADQVVSLKNEGVSETVIGAMLTAPVVPEERTVEVVYDYPYYSYPYYYPYSYYPYSYPYSYGFYGSYGYYGYPYYHGYAHYPYYYHGTYPASHATSVSTYRK
jgi:hypothetical protein